MISLPLEGVLILDFTRLLPGPFATQILADLGARVIKIESPITDMIRFTPPFIKGEKDDELWSGLFLAVNRNKESVTLNLKKNVHKEILKELLKKADVFIEGFRPGIMEKLGFDYGTVSKLNPKLIYCSLSGFGQTGDMRDRPAHDLNYLGLAGLLSSTRFSYFSKQYPPISMPLVPIADFSGAMFAVIGILTGIFARTKTDKGCYVDTSLFESVFSWISGFPGALQLLNVKKEENDEEHREIESLKSNVLNGSFPFYTIYQTSDKKWISLGALEPIFWEEFCKTLGMTELIEKQFNISSGEESEEIYLAVQERIREKTLNEWLDIFKDVNTCFQPIKTITEVKDDNQVKERKMIIEVPHPAGGSFFTSNLPLKFSEWDINNNPRKPPDSGENNLKILKEFGIDDSLKNKFE